MQLWFLRMSSLSPAETSLSEFETRFITLGQDPTGRVLVVIYTWRGEKIRLISARKATSKERRTYEK